MSFVDVVRIMKLTNCSALEQLVGSSSDLPVMSDQSTVNAILALTSQYSTRHRRAVRPGLVSERKRPMTNSYQPSPPTNDGEEEYPAVPVIPVDYQYHTDEYPECVELGCDYQQ